MSATLVMIPQIQPERSVSVSLLSHPPLIVRAMEEFEPCGLAGRTNRATVFTMEYGGTDPEKRGRRNGSRPTYSGLSSPFTSSLPMLIYFV